MGVTPERSRSEFQVGPSEASIPIQDRLIPWVNLADVDLVLLGRVSLLRITLAPKKLIRTRRASEGSASEPSLARRVSVCKDAKLSCRGNILRSVISGHPKGRSVVPRSSCLPESSPRLSAPALRSWQAGAVQFTAKICRLVGRATMDDPPSAGGAFSPVSGR